VSETLANLRSPARAALPAVLLGVVASIDYVTGRDLGIFVFYFVPVALAAWIGGLPAGIAAAGAAALAWFAVDALFGRSYTLWYARYWNTGIRLTAFLVIAVSMTRIRNSLALERRLNQELSQAMGRIKRLRGLVPICGSCKSIRNDAGYWQELESYIASHTEAELSHGLCPDCLKRLTAELDRPQRIGPAPPG
jgi:hypothetical protein